MSLTSRLSQLSQLLTLITAALFFTLAGATSASAVADRNTSAQLMPVGDYLCGMGSYKLRPCQVVSDGDGVKLLIESDGHFIQMSAEILPSDDTNEVTVLGTLAPTSNLCGAGRCTPGEEGCYVTKEAVQQCRNQQLTARMTKKKGVFRGKLSYFINRYSKKDGKPSFFKLGNTIRFVIKPVKKR